jgi:hypothetical protein
MKGVSAVLDKRKTHPRPSDTGRLEDPAACPTAYCHRAQDGRRTWCAATPQRLRRCSMTTKRAAAWRRSWPRCGRLMPRNRLPRPTNGATGPAMSGASPLERMLRIGRELGTLKTCPAPSGAFLGRSKARRTCLMTVHVGGKRRGSWAPREMVTCPDHRRALRVLDLQPVP